MYSLKPFAAFGYVLMRNIFPDGTILNSEVNQETPCTLYCTRGNIDLVIEESGYSLNMVPGTYVTPDQYVLGLYKHTTIGESVLWCYDPRLNRGFTPPIEKFSLSENSEIELKMGTKLFLCEGKLAVGELETSKPTQLLIKSGDTVVRSVTNCYGFIFG